MNSVDQECWAFLFDDWLWLCCEAVRVCVDEGVAEDEGDCWDASSRKSGSTSLGRESSNAPNLLL